MTLTKATTLFLTAALAVTLATPKEDEDRNGRGADDRVSDDRGRNGNGADDRGYDDRGRNGSDDRGNDNNDDRGRGNGGGDARVAKILEWDTMVGVPKSFTGSTNAIRGVNGGGLPWIVGSAHGELKIDGKLEVEVTGLVLDPADPDVVSRNLANQNPAPFFRAVVSCLNATGGTTNLQTDQFPATLGTAESGGGNASIEARLDLPQPCIAPVVFVTSANGAWFAVTGR